MVANYQSLQISRLHFRCRRENISQDFLRRENLSASLLRICRTEQDSEDSSGNPRSSHRIPRSVRGVKVSCQGSEYDCDEGPLPYGCFGLLTTSVDGPLSTIVPLYITSNRLHINAATARSWVIKSVVISCFFMISSRRLIIPSLRDASSIDVASSATRNSGRRIMALAIATRCLVPAELKRIFVYKIIGRVSLTSSRALTTISSICFLALMPWTRGGNARMS